MSKAIPDFENSASDGLIPEIIDNNCGMNVFQEMPADVVENHKKFLSEKKKQLSLKLDNKKLDEAVKIMGGMESITDILTDPEVLDRVKESTSTAMDIKFLSDAYGKFADKMQMLQRLDTIDGEGNSSRILLQLDDGKGGSIKAMIEK